MRFLLRRAVITASAGIPYSGALFSSCSFTHVGVMSQRTGRINVVLHQILEK